MQSSGARFLPHLVYLTLVLIWSLSFVVAKFSLATLSATALVAIRFWLAVGVVAPMLGRSAMADLRAARGPGLTAGAALALGYLLQMLGMTETTASMGGLLAGLIVPLVALGGWMFFGSHLGPKSLLGLLCAIAGIVLICVPENTAGGGQDSLRGILLQVGSSTSYAVHVLLLSRFGRTAPVAAFTFWQLLVVAAAGSVAVTMTGLSAAGHPVVLSTNLVLALFYLGVIASGLAIFVQVRVQHRIPPTHVALLLAMQPLFATLGGALLQGDRLGAAQLCGGAIIVLGVVITSLDRLPTPAAMRTGASVP